MKADAICHNATDELLQQLKNEYRSLQHAFEV